VHDELGRVALDDGRRVGRREHVNEGGDGGEVGRARVLHRSADHAQSTAVALREVTSQQYSRFMGEKQLQ
ncbi:hypothetical protein PENTCL1PPCAC_10489, partial [Pristionchus entomophagus]